MGMRVSGMYSGLDTESIISELVSAKSAKVTKLKNDKQKLEWKQEVWQGLNSKIYSLYSSKLTKMRYESSYVKRKTSSSNENVVSVVAGDGSVLGSQTLKVNKLAQTGYLTGAQIKGKTSEDNPDGKIALDTKLTDINENLNGSKLNLKVGDGEEKEIEITADMTVNGLLSKFKEAGINATFDTNNQRFFLNGKEMGTEADFTLTSTSMVSDGNGGANNALRVLGLDTTATEDEYMALYGTKSSAVKLQGQDAEIELNGATFKGKSNTFVINGLTLDIKDVTATGETVTITTTSDTNGIYDMIKDFFTEYNDMINSVAKYYNAESASKYDILTAEQKESMTDEEIENWENKIKDSLLRRDPILSILIQDLNSIMTGGIDMDDGVGTDGKPKTKKMYLSEFGIKTLNYFEAEDNEHYSFHIDGDDDDEKTKTNADKLKKMIASDPEKVTEFFSSLSKKIYEHLDKAMESTDYSSIYKVYNDKELKKETTNFEKKIKEAQKALNAYEDKWYDKFTAMEVAMSKLQSNQNAVSRMLQGL